MGEMKGRGKSFIIVKRNCKLRLLIMLSPKSNRFLRPLLDQSPAWFEDCVVLPQFPFSHKLIQFYTPRLFSQTVTFKQVFPEVQYATDVSSLLPGPCSQSMQAMLLAQNPLRCLLKAVLPYISPLNSQFSVAH